MTTYEVTTRGGETHTVECLLTNAECAEVIRSAPKASDFARDLASKASLSPKQEAWLHVLTRWIKHPKTQPSSGLAFPAIQALLQKGFDSGRAFPKLRLRVDGERIVLARSGAGKINVSDGAGYAHGQWFGAIQLDGTWRGGRAKSTLVMETLANLEQNGIAFLNSNGIETGECCYCNSPIETDESIAVGYGPICAKRYGLPWGKVVK